MVNISSCLETLPERFAEVLSDLLYTDTAHGADCQGPDQWVWVLAVLDEGVDRHDGHVRLGLGVVHQVQVHKLLQLYTKYTFSTGIPSNPEPP